MEAGSTRTIEVEGRRLVWRSLGSGPPLLLINGYAATGADWDPTFLAALSAEHSVLCPDNRGMGESDLGETALSVDGMAADLEALLDALGVGSLPVVGWSMGGFVAQRLAETAPGRVSALALLSTDPGGAESVPADPEAWGSLIDRSGTAREQATRLISLLFPAGVAEEVDREFGDLVAEARGTLSDESLRAQERAMVAWHDAEREAAVAPPPTVVLHGAEDAVIPAANAVPLAHRWSARHQVLEGCAHAAMAQRPEPVAEAILAIASA
jgi:pimeloyl-ACP methyl ester carboxylesterase